VKPTGTVRPTKGNLVPTTLLNAAETRAALPMPQAIAAVRDAFIGLGEGHFELPPRTVLGDGSALSMAVHHRPTRSTVVKSLSIDFARTPAIVGALVRVGTDSADTLVADAATVTAIRTGAVVGVATDLLAPAGARHLVLVGTGAQAADQLRAVRAVRSLDAVTFVSRRLEAAETFRDGLDAELSGLEVTVTTDLEAALGRADVVCCATPATEPLFRTEWLPGRVHVNAIGSYRLAMRELPDDLLAGATVVVDQVEAVLEESGEIDHAIAAGVLAVDALVELSDALAHRPPLADRTVFKSVGVAVQDWAMGNLLAHGVLGA
jgi:ornithine cyclodeaminase/alanine dehydrogenase-like protein (mu-crystallin family)